MKLIGLFRFQEERESEEPETKRLRVGNEAGEEEEQKRKGEVGASCSNSNPVQLKNNNNISSVRRIESGTFSKIPPELFPHILKFLSSEVPFLNSLV